MQVHDATDLPIAGPSLDALRATRRWALVPGGFWITAVVGGDAASIAVYPRLISTGMPGASAADVAAMTLASVWLLRYAGAIRAVFQMPEWAQASLDRAVASQRKRRTLLGVLAVAGLVAGLALVVVFAVIGMHALAPAGLHT